MAMIQVFLRAWILNIGLGISHLHTDKERKDLEIKGTLKWSRKRQKMVFISILKSAAEIL